MDTGCIFSFFRFNTDISDVISSKQNIPAYFRYWDDDKQYFVKGRDNACFVANVFRYSLYLLDILSYEGELDSILISEKRDDFAKAAFYCFEGDTDLSFGFYVKGIKYNATVLLDDDIVNLHGNNIVYSSLQLINQLKNGRRRSNSSSFTYLQQDL